MRKLVPALAIAAFAGLTMLDAHAVGNSSWMDCRGTCKAKLKQRSARRDARRAARKDLIRDGFLSIATSDLYFSSETLFFTSPVTINSDQTVAFCDTVVPDATDVEALSSAESGSIQSIQSLVRNKLGQPLAKAATLSFNDLTITSFTAKGAYRAVSNFRKIVGSEKFTFTAILIGGDDDGVEVTGSVKIKLGGNRSESM